MKLRSIFMVALLAVACAIQAVPAKRGAVKIQQPDGSYVTIRLHGDEWHHYQTTDDGYSIVKNSRGFYVYAQLQDGQLAATEQVAHDPAERTALEQTFLNGIEKHLIPEMSVANSRLKKAVQARQAETLAAPNKIINYNQFKGLVILAEFNDKTFSRDDYPAIINDMINKEGYTGYDNEQLTGSVRDYFSDNSDGKFKPVFDVVGPYTINFSQYDANGSENGNELVRAAIDAADADVNFKDYDLDNNGYVDLVYVIFAGEGSNIGGNDSRLFWPHRSVVFIPYPNNPTWIKEYVKKDGVTIFDYAASVEMTTSWRYYTPREQLDGIGTICHEFSHVLGLPDFYDTNYETEGLSCHPDDWSLMASGSYLNDSRTPCGYSLYERDAVGFMNEPQKIEAEGSYTLNPLATTFEGYRIDSPFSKEFYLLENRQKNAFKWDSYLPGSGMLVFRVDKSKPSAWDLSNNTVNANPNRNYYELIRADGNHTNSDGRPKSLDSDPFPGSADVTSLDYTTSPAALKSLSGTGRETRWALSNIKKTGSTITFDITDTWTIKSLSLPEEITIGVGMNGQIQPTVEPANAQYLPSWVVTSGQDVASVNASTGVITGTKVGTSKVMLIATPIGDMTQPITATCTVNVIEIPSYNIAEFNELETDKEQLLKFTNAEVLYVKNTDAYIRDASGSVMFTGKALGLKRNDIINGFLVALPTVYQNMPQAKSVETTNTEALTITAGPEVQPVEKKLSELTAADYSNYVLVKGAKMIKDGVAWVVDGDVRARVSNKLYSFSLSNYEGKFYDIPCIYGTEKRNGQIVNALYVIGTPVQVEEPSGISEIRMDVKQDGRFYNLQGQRVGDNYKGIVIVNGKKVKK